jgi:protein-tyrosine phosphatase
VSDFNSGGTRLTVLAVCEANLCVSPLTEFLLRADCAKRGIDLRVSSAGLWATPGQPMHPSTRKLLQDDFKIDVGEWRTTSVDPDMIERSDLILAATANDRGEVIGAVPAVLKRTFSLLDWARIAPLIGQLPMTSAEFRAELPHLVAEARGHLQPVLGGTDLDSFAGRRYSAFRAEGATIARATESAVRPFRGAATSAAHRD